MDSVKAIFSSEPCGVVERRVAEAAVLRVDVAWMLCDPLLEMDPFFGATVRAVERPGFNLGRGVRALPDTMLQTDGPHMLPTGDAEHG